MKQVTARVISNERILGELQRKNARTYRRPQARNILGTWLMWLNCPEIALEAKPGQFVMVKCAQEYKLPRPFSINRIKEGNVAIVYSVWEDGTGTKWLSQLTQSDDVELFGPLGNGYNISSKSHNLLFVAGGPGIIPLIFLAEQAVSQGCTVKLLRGASGEYKPSMQPNPSQHYPDELLPQGIEVETITTDPEGMTGMVLDLLKSETVNWADQVFACGPTPMYREMACRKEELGLTNKSVQISLEMRMGCGRGVCYSCTIRTRQGLKQVCHDGPVFPLDDIVWDELSLAGI